MLFVDQTKFGDKLLEIHHTSPFGCYKQTTQTVVGEYNMAS
jgi:hypothetical protein